MSIACYLAAEYVSNVSRGGSHIRSTVPIFNDEQLSRTNCHRNLGLRIYELLEDNVMAPVFHIYAG